MANRLGILSKYANKAQHLQSGTFSPEKLPGTVPFGLQLPRGGGNSSHQPLKDITCPPPLPMIQLPNTLFEIIGVAGGHRGNRALSSNSIHLIENCRVGHAKEQSWFADETSGFQWTKTWNSHNPKRKWVMVCPFDSRMYLMTYYDQRMLRNGD